MSNNSIDLESLYEPWMREIYNKCQNKNPLNWVIRLIAEPVFMKIEIAQHLVRNYINNISTPSLLGAIEYIKLSKKVRVPARWMFRLITDGYLSKYSALGYRKMEADRINQIAKDAKEKRERDAMRNAVDEWAIKELGWKPDEY